MVQKNEKKILGELINYLYTQNKDLFSFLALYLVKKYNKPIVDILNDTNIIKQDILDLFIELLYNDVNLSSFLNHFFIHDDYLDSALPEMCLLKTNDIELIFETHSNYILDSTNSFEERYGLFFDLLIRIYRYNLDVSRLKDSYLSLLEDAQEMITIKKTELSSQKRVFLYTNQYLESIHHAPSNQIRIWAAAFDKLDVQVIVVSCTPLPYPYKLNVTNMAFNLNKIGIGNVADLYKNTFIIELSGNPFYNNLYEDFCNGVSLNDNDTFILVGEFCLQFDLLPFENKYLIPSSKDICVTTANKLLANIDLNVNNLKNEKLEFIYTTNDFTLSDDVEFSPSQIKQNELLKFVVIGNRLQYEIDDEFWNGIEKLYDKYLNIIVYIVGPFDKECIPKKLEKIIDCVGYQYDLKGFLSDKHFYLNPRRNGGGQSALLALKMGMPILSVDHGDVSSVINHLYCINSLNDIDEFVFKYINDVSFKKTIDEYNLQLKEKSSLDKDSLERTCQDIIGLKND